MAHMLSLKVAILLSFCSLYANATEITENGYPILWEKSPGQLTELPSVDDVIVINPWNYLQRMSLYKLTLQATDMYMTSMGENATENPLWGLPLQLAWKLKSGRLVDPSGVTTCGKETGDPMCISPKSWWACVNYYLSVIPFLAAVETGIVGQGLKIQIQAPSEASEDYCVSFSDCTSKHPEMMSKWKTFFLALKNLSSADIPQFEKKDQILGFMWEAQQASMHTGSKCKERLKHYSTLEVTFSRSWTKSVDYVAATRLHSNMERSKLFTSPLPSRILREGDKPPNAPGLSSEENHTLSVFTWMDSMNTLLGGTLVQMWQSAMCSERTREKGQALLQDLVLDPKFVFSGLLTILIEMGSSC
ncbi:hypothetical protein MATL_G00205150 [Megalops atlanticus]|uniref:Protein LEG1 homolog n=1 Tax=Megalops atlanticus TaxID=7932 RepID=A0A9D3T4Z1_MEGAT|nr:hypothetical protein MATL_G00205150 [Megalops atlanticus]